jgi:hypothetical protein
MNYIVQYDNSNEEVVDRFLFKLDENPILKINPIEETSYLGIPFSISVDLYYGRIQDEVKKYKDYIKDFVQKILKVQRCLSMLNPLLIGSL